MALSKSLVKLIARVREAVDRGDMFVGHKSEFPLDIRIIGRWVDVPIGIFDDRVLLKFDKPLMAVTRNNDEVSIVSCYDGTYYTVSGHPYREKDLAFKKEKALP